MPLIVMDSTEEKTVVRKRSDQLVINKGPDGETKKSGLAMVTLNLHSQPRLPGSVVGEWSMR